MKLVFAIVFVLLSVVMVVAQVPFGHEQAIRGDSSIIVAWASGCTVQRGYQHIGDSSLGLASVGSNASAAGKARENGFVSLGDGGSAILTFDSPISNGAGYDLTVFENGFPVGGTDTLFFLELAFVEVSSDGVNFFRFPCASRTDTTAQLGNGSGSSPKATTNLAGNFTDNYGTPFDLEQLAGTPGLNINRITHVKVTDVVGSLDARFAGRDSSGRTINDPWPTPFPSSGFDLDAVGVMHNEAHTGTGEVALEQLIVYPNPAGQGEKLTVLLPVAQAAARLELYDMEGRKLVMQPFEGEEVTMLLSHPGRGVYVLRVCGERTCLIKKIVIE